MSSGRLTRLPTQAAPRSLLLRTDTMAVLGSSELAPHFNSVRLLGGVRAPPRCPLALRAISRPMPSTSEHPGPAGGVRGLGQGHRQCCLHLRVSKLSLRFC